MGEETLSAQELDALLEDADIIYDDTKQYIKQTGETDEELKVKGDSEYSSFYDKIENRNIAVEEHIDVNNMSKHQMRNADLLLDIYVQITVELGRTNIKVKDVLGLGEGSIIELSKPASEPVDLLVNNRLIAHGEVVVIDENFGTRVTNIVNPEERINK